MFPPRVRSANARSALSAGGKKMAEVQMCVLRGKGSAIARVQRSRDRDKIGPRNAHPPPLKLSTRSSKALKNFNLFTNFLYFFSIFLDMQTQFPSNVIGVHVSSTRTISVQSDLRKFLICIQIFISFNNFIHLNVLISTLAIFKVYFPTNILYV